MGGRGEVGGGLGAGFIIGLGFIFGEDLLGDGTEDGHELVGGGVAGESVDKLLGFDEAGDGGGEEGGGADELAGLNEVLGFGGAGEQVAEEDTHDGDLVVEVGGVGGVGEVLDVGGGKGAGIEAVFTGVLVAGLAAAMARGKGRHRAPPVRMRCSHHRTYILFCLLPKVEVFAKILPKW